MSSPHSPDAAIEIQELHENHNNINFDPNPKQHGHQRSQSLKIHSSNINDDKEVIRSIRSHEEQGMGHQSRSMVPSTPESPTDAEARRASNSNSSTPNRDSLTMPWVLERKQRQNDDEYCEEKEEMFTPNTITIRPSTVSILNHHDRNVNSSAVHSSLVEQQQRQADVSSSRHHPTTTPAIMDNNGQDGEDPSKDGFFKKYFLRMSPKYEIMTTISQRESEKKGFGEDNVRMREKPPANKNNNQGDIELRHRVASWLKRTGTDVVLDYIQVVLGIGCVAMFIVQTYNESWWEAPAFSITEIVMSCFFTLDWMLSMFVASNRLYYLVSLYSLVDIFTVVPLFVMILIHSVDQRESTTVYTATWSNLGVLRIVRALRLLRVLHSFKVWEMHKRQTNVNPWFPELLRVLFSVTSLVVIFAGLFLVVEHDAQPLEFHEAFYFIVITLSTVGYGDYQPTTWYGQLLIVFMIGVAVFLLPNQLVQLTMREMQAKRRQRYRLSQNGKPTKNLENYSKERHKYIIKRKTSSVNNDTSAPPGHRTGRTKAVSALFKKNKTDWLTNFSLSPRCRQKKANNNAMTTTTSTKVNTRSTKKSSSIRRSRENLARIGRLLLQQAVTSIHRESTLNDWLPFNDKGTLNDRLPSGDNPSSTVMDHKIKP
eukprot:g1973.t1